MKRPLSCTTFCTAAIANPTRSNRGFRGEIRRLTAANPGRSDTQYRRLMIQCVGTRLYRSCVTSRPAECTNADSVAGEKSVRCRGKSKPYHSERNSRASRLSTLSVRRDSSPPGRSNDAAFSRSPLGSGTCSMTFRMITASNESPASGASASVPVRTSSCCCDRAVVAA